MIDSFFEDLELSKLKSVAQQTPLQVHQAPNYEDHLRQNTSAFLRPDAPEIIKFNQEKGAQRR